MTIGNRLDIPVVSLSMNRVGYEKLLVISGRKQVIAAMLGFGGDRLTGEEHSVSCTIGNWWKKGENPLWKSKPLADRWATPLLMLAPPPE
jgi:hypothetical protein